MNLNSSNYDIENAAQDWRDNQLADYLAVVDSESDTKIFDENCEIANILGEMVLEREVYFQPSWQMNPTLFTVQFIVLDRLEWGDESDQFAISKCFTAAMFNEDQGNSAVDIAQSVDMERWVTEFFEREIANVPSWWRVGK